MAKYKDKLVEYIVNVNQDYELHSKHNADPEAAAKAYGLSDDDVKAVAKGNQKEIVKRCQDAGVELQDVLLLTFHTPS